MAAGCTPVKSGQKGPILEVKAFVLAGGKSLRMGRDKAFVLWDGRTLLERAVALAKQVAGNVRIVGSKGKYESYGEVLEDVYPDRGPLGGIHAALSVTSEEFNLILGVDLPFMTPGLLEYLIEQARETKALVAVPRFVEGWQPLCAVYRKAFVNSAEVALISGQNAVHSLLERTECRVLDESELGKAGFSRAMFRNINTVEDLANSSIA